MNCERILTSVQVFEKCKKPTRLEKFLAEVKQVVPWKELYMLKEAFCPKIGKVDPALEWRLRIHFLLSWFNPGDPAAEESRWGTKPMKCSAGIDPAKNCASGESIISKFRCHPKTNTPGNGAFKNVDSCLLGTAAIISTPTSRKNYGEEAGKEAPIPRRMGASAVSA